MRSRIQIVSEVFFEDVSQIGLAEDDHVVETLASDAFDEPLGEWILPWTAGCSEHLLNAHSLNSISEVTAVDGVTIP
jgi:hypothetical protein